MPRKNRRDPDDPKPLNFDHDSDPGYKERLKHPYQSPSDLRGDNEDDQYYDTEEELSPEEDELRKEEGTL